MTLRELVEVSQIKQRNAWEQTLTLAELIINSQPHFGKTRPKYRDFRKLNPFGCKESKRQRSGILLQGEAGERILDAMCE